mgnify:CR=1 FL=1
MENVIQFPTQPVRDWLLIERSMNETLESHRVSEAAHSRLVKIMKEFYQETLNFKFNLSTAAEFPGTLSANEVSSICSEIGNKIGKSSSEQLQAFTKSLFLERLRREVEVCRELGLL